MLQRIQSVYILLSFILGVVGLCNPLGRFTADGEHLFDVYNLWMTSVGDKAHVLTPWVALFAILVVATTLTFLSIMLFTRRALQMRVLIFSILLLVGYYACLGVFVYLHKDMHFSPSLFAALPFACGVFDYLAFRGVLKDELLVRSLDRLR